MTSSRLLITTSCSGQRGIACLSLQSQGTGESFNNFSIFMVTRVVHLKKSPFDVYVGRPSRWGNPFEVGRDGTRLEVIAKYREWLLGQPELLADLYQLRGKVLGCWCKPDACHGDVLAALADSPLELT